MTDEWDDYYLACSTPNDPRPQGSPWFWLVMLVLLIALMIAARVWHP